MKLSESTNLSECGVILKKVPATCNARQAAAFVRELAESMARVVRPCVVLDCSPLRRVDNAFLNLLLRSLEEAMKRNGDVRLSGFPDEARPALESVGMEKLFQFFFSVTEAAQSFRRPSASATPLPPPQHGLSQPFARAA